MMKRKYFLKVKTLSALKREYRRLLFKNHPDNGGDVKVMQEINAEYDYLSKILPDITESEDTTEDAHESAKGNTRTSQSGNTYSTHSTEMDEELASILETVSIIPGVNSELCGSWIWVSGNTYPIKERLKEMGFRFSSQKKMWYYHKESQNHRYYKGKKGKGMDEIRRTYGSETMERRASTLA